MYPYLVVFLKFTCTIILRFLYDHLERNEENVDLHRDVKVTFVSSVFLQMDTDIIGSVLFTIRRSFIDELYAQNVVSCQKDFVLCESH